MNPVLISYSHDSPAHAAKVKQLADTLRRLGVKAEIDQYVPAAGPAGGWARWMSRLVEAASHIIVVCTETYRRRFNGDETPGVGRGVTWEGLLLQQVLYEADSRNHRLLPVLFDNEPESSVPLILRPFRRFSLPQDFKLLYAVVTGQGDARVPVVGERTVDVPDLRPTPLDEPWTELGRDLGVSSSAAPSGDARIASASEGTHAAVECPGLPGDVDGSLHDDRLLEARLRKLLTGENKRPVFLVGSALTMPTTGRPGVPLTSQVVDQLRSRLIELGAAVSGTETRAESTADRYQRYATTLSKVHPDEVDSVIRKLVLASCQPREHRDIALLEEALESTGSRQLRACQALQELPDVWHLCPAAEALAASIAIFRQSLTYEQWQRYRPVIVTTNFDGLLAIALSRIQLKPRVIEVGAGAALNLDLLPPNEIPICHIYGYWCGSTIYGRDQVRTNIPALLRSMQSPLSESIVVTMGYGGWESAYLQGLVKLADQQIASRQGLQLLFSFYDDDDDLLEHLVRPFESAMNRLTAANRAHLYRYIDVQVSLPRLYRSLVTDQRARVRSLLTKEIFPIWMKEILRQYDRASGGFRVYGDVESSRTQVWASAQCLVGLLNHDTEQLRVAAAAVGHQDDKAFEDIFVRAAEYMEDAGWGLWRGQEPVTAIGGWVTIAQTRIYALLSQLGANDDFRATLKDRITRNIRRLVDKQAPNGAIVPLGDVVDDNGRTYSTICTLWAVVVAAEQAVLSVDDTTIKCLQKAIDWLVSSRREGRWVPQPSRKYARNRRFLGLDAMAIYAITLCRRVFGAKLTVDNYEDIVGEFLSDRDLVTRTIDDSDALLDRDQHVQGSNTLLEASSFLWFPWTLAAVSELAKDTALSEYLHEQALAVRDRRIIRLNRDMLSETGDEGVYRLAEFLIGLGMATATRNSN